MRVEAFDGLFYLASPSFDGELPAIPEGPGPQVAATDGLMLITAITPWEPMTVSVLTQPEPLFTMPGAWEYELRATLAAEGELRVCDMEFDSSGASLDDGAVKVGRGQHLVQVLARSRDAVKRSGQFRAPDEQLDEYLLVVCPGRGRAVLTGAIARR